MAVSTEKQHPRALPMPTLGRIVINPELAQGDVNRSDPQSYLRADGVAFGWRFLQLGDVVQLNGQTMVVDDAPPEVGESPTAARQHKLIFRPAQQGDLNYRGHIILGGNESEAPHALPFEDPQRDAHKPGEFRFVVSPRTGQFAVMTSHLASRHWRAARYGECVGAHDAFTQRDDDGRRTLDLVKSLHRKFGFEQEYHHSQVGIFKAEINKIIKDLKAEDETREYGERLETYVKEFDQSAPHAAPRPQEAIDLLRKRNEGLIADLNNGGPKERTFGARLFKYSDALEHARKERTEYNKLRGLLGDIGGPANGDHDKKLVDLVELVNKMQNSGETSLEEYGKLVKELDKVLKKAIGILERRLEDKQAYTLAFLRRERDDSLEATNEERYEKWRAWNDFNSLTRPAMEALKNISKSIHGETVVDGFIDGSGSTVKVRALTIPEDYYKGKILNKDGTIITPGHLRWSPNINGVWDEKGSFGPRGRWVHARIGLVAQITMVEGTSVYETVYGDTDFEAERAASAQEQRDAPGQAPSYMVCWNGITWRDRQAAELVLSTRESWLLNSIMKPVAALFKTRAFGIGARKQEWELNKRALELDEEVRWEEKQGSRRIFDEDTVTSRNEHTWIAKEEEFEIGRANPREALLLKALVSDSRDVVSEDDLIRPVPVKDVPKINAETGARRKKKVWSPLAKGMDEEPWYRKVFGEEEDGTKWYQRVFRTEGREEIFASGKVSPMWYVAAMTASQLMDKYQHDEGGLGAPNIGKRVVSTTRVWEAEYAQARAYKDLTLGLRKLVLGGPGVLVASLVGAGIAFSGFGLAGAGLVAAAGAVASSVWGQVHQDSANNPHRPESKRNIPDELRDRLSEFAVVPKTSICGVSFYWQALRQAKAGLNALTYSFGARVGRRWMDTGIGIAGAASGLIAAGMMGLGTLGTIASAGLLPLAALLVTGKLISLEKGEQQTLKYIVGEPNKSHPLWEKYSKNGLKSLTAEEVMAHGLPFFDGVRNPTQRNRKFFVREVRLVSEDTGIPMPGVDKDQELR